MSGNTAELYHTDIDWGPVEQGTVEPAGEDPLIAVLIEATAYRLVMQEAVHALAVVVQEYDRLEKRYHRVLDQRRGPV